MTELAAARLEAGERAALVKRGLWLNYATLGYNAVEAVVSIVAGLPEDFAEFLRTGGAPVAGAGVGR